MRHGTLNAYKNCRCRCDLCSEASYRYEKRRKYLHHIGQPATLPALGFQRRARALMALGWTHRQIAEALGIAPGNLSAKLRLNGAVTRATHEAMCDLFERWSMTLPADTVVNRRTRAWAQKRGYLPPLVWDDIDTDPTPHVTRGEVRHHTDVDHAVVERLIDGQRIPSTRAEKDEAMRRWRARGRSERELCLLQGWKDARYGREEGAA